MAYRPTNNIQENIIHRNTVFDSQGMVACCTCGYCIEKNEDATLTLTNFKAADPLVNENSIGSTIIEFSDYMIPVGSFEYSLTPYKYPVSVSSLQDESLVSDNKFATGLAYYPFLRCDGVQTTALSESPYNFEDPLSPIQTNKQYGSSFAYTNSQYGYYYNNLTAFNPELLDNGSSMSFTNTSTYTGSVAYDPIEFGSYAYTTTFAGGYSNTDINLTHYWPSICIGTYPDQGGTALTALSCGDSSEYYKWGRIPYYLAYGYPQGYQSYLRKELLTNILDNGVGYYYGYFYNYNSRPKRANLGFSDELSYNLESVVGLGPTSNFVAQSLVFGMYFGNNYFWGWYYYDPSLFLALSEFTSGANGGYVSIMENGLSTARSVWYEPGESGGGFTPCTQEQMILSFNLDPATHNVQSYFDPISIPLPPADIGSAQAYFDYIDTHDYSQKGFRVDAECANGIAKVMEPVFFADFDDYEFSFQYEGFSLLSKTFYMTDKFLVPDRNSWSDCLQTYTRPNVNSPWEGEIPPTPAAKTVKFQTMNPLYNVYKEGYVLDRFQLGSDGSFLATLSIINESPFYSVGLESEYFFSKQQGYIYPNNGGYCSYFQNLVLDHVSRYYQNYWWGYNNNFSSDNYSSPLLYEGKFISNATPLQFSEYIDQETIGIYTNGYFTYHSPIRPFIYYEDACEGFMSTSVVGELSQYVAQKTERTSSTSRTDSSGWTTMIIENVLWAGKTLLTETYFNESSSYAIAGGVTKIIITSQVQNSFANPPIVTISAPNGPNPVQATAVAVLNQNGFISEIVVTNPGNGYRSVPFVTFNTGGFNQISARAEIEDERQVLGQGNRVPSSYTATLKGGFESDIEVGFQSVAICKNENIADRMKRVSQVKVTFENYEKIPQVNTLLYDYQQSFIDATPETPDGYFNSYISSYMSEALANIAFAPPSINEDEPIFLRVKNGAYEILKQFEEIDTPVSKSLTFSPGRVYPDFGVPDRFKSCLLINGDSDVWATGNEVKFGSSATVYYSIYMEEIKDEKQTAGQSLIRIATTLQDANDGVYIPNVGLAYPYSGKSLTVTFLYGWEDSARTNAPQYEEEFDPNGLDFSNFNADKIGASASEVGEFTVNTSGLMDIYGSSNFPVPSFYWQGIYYSSYDRLEVISLSPLIIKYVGTRFLSQSSKTYTISDLITPDNITVPDFSASRKYGFMCDMIVEEVVDEFIEEALPVEFNQILENVEYIQTSNLINSRTPMQMINPEQCEHIGKVIDRKNCNCPKKWIRLCDVHGKTDWKKCMQCKDFKVSE